MYKIDGSLIISLDGVGSRIFLALGLSNAAEFIVIQPCWTVMCKNLWYSHLAFKGATE
jgi:hypothetical protein